MTARATPSVASAAATARAISRLLRTAGFVMADVSDRYNWTEGIFVRRVGVSSLVNVDYHVPGYSNPPEKKFHRKAERERALALLAERGYPIEGGGVRCERE